MSQFAFLRTEWPPVFEAAARAEVAVHGDPRIACFYARRALELAVSWAFKHDPALRLPYQDNLSALIHEPTFKQAAGDAVFNKARVINTLGNRAVHGARAVPAEEAVTALRELFHVTWWLAHTYTRGSRPAAGLAFDPARLPRPAARPQPTPPEQLQQMATALRERDEKLAAVLADRKALDEELVRLRAEVAAARAAAASIPDTHDYSEAETRAAFIDLLLKEAGWPLDTPRDREFEVEGMPNTQGLGYVDYVLWGDDGKPLGLVEAKRTCRDPLVGQQQAKLYADCLEARFGQRPVIFCSNGYEHWLWDDSSAPPREVQGFYKKPELALLIQRRTTRLRLGDARISETIIERHYQTRAVRRVAEAFENDGERKALLVMATGAGKTRTAIALCDLLIRCRWAKRVLFLADRVALVNQAVNAFKRHLPDAAPVNLVTEREQEGRVFVSTYPTMMGLIDDIRDGQRRFGVGHFDLVIIDEAHRSVFQKYRAIFDYFDALLVGLTATPKDEIDRNTFGLFGLEDGVPTDAYSLDEAVRDGFLVPPRAISVPLKFQREGIRYKDLSPAEKEQWDEVDWEEDGSVPDHVEADAVNRWLFNQDTVDKVLAHVMTQGLRVAGGDRLGKTILFAKNQDHAQFIAQRFDANYPNLKGSFARVITYKTEYAQSLIDDFAKPERPPHLAISVDMLDTGIDVPEVLNLVFFKLVRSKTKFWQMVGRGTRLRPDLFGPGRHKELFAILDYCQNLEFFSENPEGLEPPVTEPLGKRLFKARVSLVAALDGCDAAGVVADLPFSDEPTTLAAIRQSVATALHAEVAAMNVGNFVVRPQRRFVERFSSADAWVRLPAEAQRELMENVAGLPSELPEDKEETKRFDLLLLYLQLAVLGGEARSPWQGQPKRWRSQVMAIAAALEHLGAIPAVRPHLSLIHELQSEEWWENVTVPMLEAVRRRLRGLVPLIEKGERRVVYTDFEDEMGDALERPLPGIGNGIDLERFRDKARAFLRAHQDHIAIHKLRMNRPLTRSDLEELEKMLIASGAGSAADIERATAAAKGLGVFVRSLVGLDRAAATDALSGFLAAHNPTGNQIEFLKLVVDHLTEHGVMSAAALYESPFTDVSPLGPEGVFSNAQVTSLLDVLESVKSTAIVAA